MYVMEMDWKQTVWLCVIPYIPFDVAKIIAVSIIGPAIKKNVK